MNKFWEWMQLKGRADGNESLKVFEANGDETAIEAPEEFIMGYAMEYLDEKIPGWQKKPTWTDCDTTERRISWLKNKIEHLE